MHTTQVTIGGKHKHLASKARIYQVKTRCSDITRNVTNDFCRFNQCFSVISDLFFGLLNVGKCPLVLPKAQDDVFKCLVLSTTKLYLVYF